MNRTTYTMNVSPPSSDTTTARLARAVVYLRVSTARQAETDDSGEGFSIPAQRDACYRKADDLGAEVVQEYLDRGESAKTADRPALQRMLGDVAAQQIDYVIVHKLDRLARSRVDDVAITMALKNAGRALVSCTRTSTTPQRAS